MYDWVLIITCRLVVNYHLSVLLWYSVNSVNGCRYHQPGYSPDNYVPIFRLLQLFFFTFDSQRLYVPQSHIPQSQAAYYIVQIAGKGIVHMPPKWKYCDVYEGGGGICRWRIRGGGCSIVGTLHLHIISFYFGADNIETH